ncbi:hypothetical protein LAZ67_1002667 [Cordylochernes scorpioides]|uniref:RNA-directed DNA polymerase n=1 Tax=Cordylochernes scorpioides TaxID=51811 RepID=A0ABY6JW98_9ARAC|nr:hypothetical protein LAZ67_1002667 [Cordylochernes scorpioides]
MTYLAKVRKCDLSKLAYELGEVVPPESRIVDLKHLILNSQSYEEEFAKQLLETLIKDRERIEEREHIEDRKRIEDRERIERKEQMVMEFELEKLRIQTTRGNNDTSRSTSNDAHYEIRKLMPKYESKDNDLSFYLILFERQAKRLGLDEDQWAFSLLGLLPYEMTQLIARETEEQSGDYRFVKRLLLKRYKLSPEQFRQKFEKHERSQKGSWRDFAFELRGYFNEWIEGMNVENFDALKDLSVTNQLKKKVPNVLRNHLIDDWTKLNNPDELADKLDEYENVRTEMGPPHWNAKHLIPPSFQQKSARFPNQSEVKETKQGTNVSGQDAARNEISETYPNTLRRMVNRTIRNDKGEPKCFNCNQFGHIARDCPAPRTTLTCRGCGQTGHKERNCTRPKEGLKVANLEVEGLETVPPDVYLKNVKIDNKETVKAMIDTGSSSCLMRESVARRISVDIEPDSTSLYGIGNQTAPAARTVGKTTVDLEIDGIVGREITVFIVNDDAQPYDLLIGRTWTDLPYVSFARIGKNLHIGYSSEFPFANLQEEIKSRRIELRATETVQLESDSINFTSAITDEVKDGYVLFTGVDDACVDSLLEVVDGKTTVPIISAGKGKLRVRKNQCVGRVELLNLDDIVVNLDVAEDSFQTKNEEKRDCFALGMEELGCTDVTKMDIKEVDGSKPVCLRPYKTTASEREAIREIVREWKDNGIVTETRSPYASPVLLVRKKTGDHRLVVDYRRLNIQTVKDKFPLPRIDDLLEGLRNAKFFTTLDLAHGYLQIPLTDKAKLKTAFITPDDTGQFERMIFGLTNAPAEFQRLMHTVLGPLLNKKAFCYLDDVIIPAKDWREMIERLREVLERIRSAKLTLKPSKCEFGRREVEFLGYVISTGGLKPGPRKIKAIEEFPEPKNVHDIRRFLGLTNFFRRFVKDFARKAEPLSRLTKKGSQFEWKEEQRRSFGGLRKDLVEYPVLAHYNPELKTEVHCDASAEGLAGMVLQMDEDCKWRLVYCVSKKTTEAEKMYHSSKLELMAIVWTLDRLRQFLVGIKFTVVTDCQALVYMNAKKTTNPQIARWYNLIQEYDFEIRHKPGEKMAHVDGMSRAPVDDPRDTMEEIMEKNLEVCLTITLEEQILMIQHSDPELRDLIQIFRKDPCDRTVGEQNRINDYSYRRKSGRGARSRRYPRRNPRRSCNASLERLRGYRGRDVLLRLPGNLTVFDISWLSVYCISFRENFGHVTIPRDVSVPADLDSLRASIELDNCEEVFPDKLQVSWKMTNDHLYVQLEGKLEDNEYMAFGRSGNDERAQMIGADVVVAFFDKDLGVVRVVDYFLTNKGQCTRTTGACPDLLLGGSQNVELRASLYEEGRLRVTYRRPLAASDALDLSIPAFVPVSMVAAIGPLNSRKEVAFHHTYFTREPLLINFGRSPASRNCSAAFSRVVEVEEMKSYTWPTVNLTHTSTFHARIGPAGGKKGYLAITGIQPWGVAWWINGRLIPELVVVRGKNYTFIVEGGDDPTHQASYHPFYITNNPRGGVAQNPSLINTPSLSAPCKPVPSKKSTLIPRFASFRFAFFFSRSCVAA